MGALFIDSGLDIADTIFARAFYKGQPELYETWMKLPLHPLQVRLFFYKPPPPPLSSPFRLRAKIGRITLYLGLTE